jgi:hypothetical protein
MPLNPLKRRTVRKPPPMKKMTTQVWEGCLGGTRVSVDPEPTADRKPPAPLAFFTFLTGTSSLETLWSQVHLALLRYEDACQTSDVQSSLDGWISLVRNAALWHIFRSSRTVQKSPILFSLAKKMAGPLAKSPQAATLPAIRPTIGTPVEWLKIQVPELKPERE